MLKKMIWAVSLLPAILLAQGWKEDFSKLNFKNQTNPGGWSVSKNCTMTLENNSFVIKSQKGTPAVSRPIEYDFTGPNRYLQMRIASGDYRILISSGIGLISDWFMIRPGLYTFPMFEMTRPDLAKKPMKGQTSLILYVPRRLQISELALVDQNAAEGVYVTVIGADGKVKDSRTAAVAGDTVLIEMQVKDKPDNLSLFLYKVNEEKTWKYRSRLESLTLPGVPLQLKESNVPNRYQASFKLQKIQKGLNLGAGKLVAAINYLGADSNDRGYFFGFCPNPVKLAGGGSAAEETSLKVYDFGPPSGPAAANAIVINNMAKHPSFRWIRPPHGYNPGFRKTLDPLMLDFAMISPKTSPEMEIKVKPGKYKVVIGVGAANAKCWDSRSFFPLRGKFFVNGKKVWEFNGGDKERFLHMDYEARVKEDIYEVYMAPYIKDLTTETDAPNGKINVKIAAMDRNIPLNYVAVYPADDKTAEARLFRMQGERRKVFNEFWDDATPKEKELRTKLSIDFDRTKGDFEIFARENPGEFIFFNTIPVISEVGAPLRLLTSPGQYGIGMILVRPFKDLKDMTAELELKDFPDATVSFAMPFRFCAYSTRNHFIGPNHFVPAGKRKLTADQSYAYRLCLKTPEKLKRGIYTGKITFTGNGQKKVLPVEVRVSDEKLPALDDHLIAMFGVTSRGQELRDDLAFCKEQLGCNTAVLMCGWPYLTKFKTDEKGFPVEVIANRQHIQEWFETYKTMNSPNKMPVVSLMSAQSRVNLYRQGPYKLHTKEYEAALKLQYEMYRDYAIKYAGATGIIADLGGEMGYGSVFPKQEVMDAAIEVFKQVSRIPNVLASYRCNCSETTKQFYPYLQVQGVRDPGSWPVSDKQSNFGKNKFLYSYSVTGRFHNGLHSWAHGARGSMREWLSWSHEVEFNDFLACCGYCGGCFHIHAMVGPGQVKIPTMRSDDFRNSVIDRQYLRMLDNAVASAKNESAKKNAENFMTILRDRADAYIQPQGIPWMVGNSVWPGIRYDMIREVIVQLCEEMKTGKRVLPEFTAVPRRIAKGQPPHPEEKSILSAPENRKGFQFDHWRDIRTGTAWEPQGLPYDGCAWYRKNIRIPKGMKTPVLRIGAADEEAWVFCNGKYIGYHNGWQEPFQFALDNVTEGETAEIAIMVYDSMNMGGIWRSVTLHKNAEDAKAGIKGINQDSGWKIALKPNGRKLDNFEFTEGPLVPAGHEKMELKIMLVPQDDAGLRKLCNAESVLEIRDLSGKVLRATKLGKIKPYAAEKTVADLKGITEKVCDAVLVTDGREFARFRFYRISFWKP